MKIGNSNTTAIAPKRVGRPPKTQEQRRIDKEAKEKKEREQWRDEMRKKWGHRFDSEGVSRDFTDAEFIELENLYDAQAAEFDNAITRRQKGGIIEICTLRLEWKRCIAAGDSAGAKRYSDMINSVMNREAMKAGDVKSLEATRIDTLIVNLEKKGAIENGLIVGKEVLAEILLHDRPQYKTSIDVVDAMMLGIINTMRKNNGESELEYLPLSAQVEDVFGELLSEPTQSEKKAMAEIGIVAPKREEHRKIL